MSTKKCARTDYHEAHPYELRAGGETRVVPRAGLRLHREDASPAPHRGGRRGSGERQTPHQRGGPARWRRRAGGEQGGGVERPLPRRASRPTPRPRSPTRSARREATSRSHSASSPTRSKASRSTSRPGLLHSTASVVPPGAGSTPAPGTPYDPSAPPSSCGGAVARIRHFTTTTRPWRRSGRARAGTPPVSTQTAYTDERVQPLGPGRPEERRRPRGAAVLVARLHRLPWSSSPTRPPRPRSATSRDSPVRRRRPTSTPARSRRWWTWTTASPSPSARLATRSTRWRRLPRRRREATGATSPGGYPV